MDIIYQVMITIPGKASIFIYIHTLYNTSQHYDDGLWLHIIREYWHKPDFWAGLDSNPAPTSDLAWAKEVNNSEDLI